MFFRTADTSSTVSSPEQREERVRMEKLLQRYQRSGSNKCYDQTFLCEYHVRQLRRP